MRQFFLALLLALDPSAVIAKPDLAQLANEVSNILCQDATYLSCVALDLQSCATGIAEHSDGCAKIFFIASSTQPLETQARQGVTNCVIEAHLRSLGLDREVVEKCYTSQKHQ